MVALTTPRQRKSRRRFVIHRIPFLLNKFNRLHTHNLRKVSNKTNTYHPKIMNASSPKPSNLRPVMRRPRSEWRIPRIDASNRLLLQRQEAAQHQKIMEGTTPHGRELLRKILWTTERLLRNQSHTRDQIVGIIQRELTVFEELVPEFTLLLG